MTGDAIALSRRTNKGKYAVDTPHTPKDRYLRCGFAKRTQWSRRGAPRVLRAPSNFEHANNNRRAIVEHTLRSRCAVNAQCRRQRRRACSQPVREWSQLIRECTQLIREWSTHQRRIWHIIFKQISNSCCVFHISLPLQTRYVNQYHSYGFYSLYLNTCVYMSCVYI